MIAPQIVEGVIPKMAATDPVHDHISDILSWFQKLEQQIPIPHTPAGKRVSRYNVAQTQKWLDGSPSGIWRRSFPWTTTVGVIG